jgi:serine/threonine-protein kinase ULK4
VNLLRLSKIVKSNLLKEAESETYRQQANSKDATDDTDVTIENHDLELNFAEGAESDSNDEEDEGVDASSPTVVSEENVPPRTVSKPGFTPADKVKIGEGDNANEQALPHFTQTESNGEDESPPKVLPDIEGTQMDAVRQVAATPPGVGIPRKGLQRAVPASGDPKKAGSTVPPTSTKLSVVLSQSLWHPTDLAVRPIMLNRRIEKVNPLFL